MSDVVLTFDLDGKRAFGSFDRLENDIFLEEGINRILSFLENLGVSGTFFMVGKNVLDFPEIHRSLKKFEIGNHSFSHYLNFGYLEEKVIEMEIVKADSVIRKVMGKKPEIFRAPDYSISYTVIDILKRLDYRMDSSLLKVIFPLKYFRNYLLCRKLEKDNFEYPLTSFIFPFNGTSVINYGLKLSRYIFNKLSKVNNTVILNFHDRDFVDLKINTSGMGRLYFKNREKSFSTIKKFLEFVTANSEKCGSFEYVLR